jgi:formylglycine-generating enzyme required for sulfatase activity
MAGILGLLMLAGFASTALAQTITIQMSQVGNPGNLGDPALNNDGSSGHGAVGYTYYIGSYDITVAQYTAFLNAVALTDPYGLYNPNMATDQNIGGIQQSGTQGGYSYSVIGTSGSDPVTYVTWLDAARFCNWLENGQPTTGIENIKTTEEGSYTLNGDTDLFGQSGSETKNPGSVWWIPTEDEWYKAAYYDPTLNEQTGNYWSYATRSNTAPGNVVGATPDQANYFISGTGYSVTQNTVLSGTQNYLTPVGSFTASASYYMTYDQSGDVFQWSDAILGTQERGLRGGAWSDGATGSVPLSSTYRFEAGPTTATNYIGFRVASSTPIPVISSTLSATGTADFPFAYQIQATGTPTSYFATGLPTGLSVTGSTGLISGTPGQTGTFGVTIGARNVAGPGTATLSLVLVAPPAPMITSALSATATNGLAFSYQILASNNPASFAATGLPGGLQVASATGVISGTPTASGTFGVSISAINLGGTDTEMLSLVVITPPAPVISSAASATGTDGIAFAYQIAASNNPTSFNATNLPPGVGFSASTGLISGTPTASGTFGPTISAINAGGTNSKTLTLVILQPAPVITSGLNASGVNGTAFNYQILGTNNADTFSATGLPPGLSVNASTGVISGTPTAGGIFPVTIGAGNDGGSTTAQLVLTLTTQFTALKGSYVGLGEVGGTDAALLNISMTNKGTFTGKFTAAGVKYSLKGTFAPYGTFVGGVVGAGSGSQNVSLAVNAATPGVSGTITAATPAGIANFIVQSSLLGTFNAASLPAGLAGKYTAMIPAASGTNPALPHAPGYGTMTVSTKGAIHLTGKLGDGTPISAAAQLDADGKTWTLFEMLYAKKTPGTVAGTMTFETLPGSDCAGAINWIKPPQATGAYYPAGFAISTDLLAATYTGAPFTTGTGITIGGGDLPVADITDSLTISAKDKVTVTGADGGVKVTLTLSTGAFTGTFLDPANANKKTTFGGAIYEKPSAEGFGQFLGPDQSGAVNITP